jgi:hypothetical protein
VFVTERLCPQLQGFLSSPPLPPDAFGTLLRGQPAPPKRVPGARR